MDDQTYLKYFEEVINSKTPEAPYTDPQYLKYAKLNFSRIARWQKTLHLDEKLVKAVKEITNSQQWIVLVEPWCGDAAPILPFIVRLAEQNPLIQLDLQLRDSEPFFD